MDNQPLKVGDVAPDFELPDETGAMRRLSDLLAGGPVVLFFYPAAMTAGCTQESCHFRDLAAEFAAVGARPVGLSADPVEKQQEFATRHSLGFPLLSDPEHAVAEAYGVWGERSMYGKKYMGIIRSAFLVDEDGKVAQAWYKVAPKDTATNLVTALA